jgi:hypothetical protein
MDLGDEHVVRPAFAGRTGENVRRVTPRRRREIDRGTAQRVDVLRVGIDSGNLAALLYPDHHGSTVRIGEADEQVRQRRRVDADALPIEPVILGLADGKLGLCLEQVPVTIRHATTPANRAK